MTLGLGTGFYKLAGNEFNDFGNQKSLGLDGTDQDITIDNICDGVLDEAVKTDVTSFSVSAWIRIGATSTSGSIFKCIAGTDTNNQINFQYHHGSAEIRFSTKFGGVNDVCNQGSNSFRADGLWHHIMGTVDVTDDTVELWIDGDLKESIDGVGTLNATITKASIGSNTASGSYWLGDVDEVALWSRQLTDEEIRSIANTAAATGNKAVDISSRFGSGLIAWYRLEEEGTVAKNDADSDTNGTINNSPTFNTYHP
jgi:hypothetical protein